MGVSTRITSSVELLMQRILLVLTLHLACGAMCYFNLVCCSSQSTLHDLSIICYGDWEQEPTFMGSHILTTLSFMHLCCLAGGHLPFLQFGNIQRSSLPQIVDGYSSAITSIAGGFPFGTSRQSTIYVSKSDYSITMAA